MTMAEGGGTLFWMGRHPGGPSTLVSGPSLRPWPGSLFFFGGCGGFQADRCLSTSPMVDAGFPAIPCRAEAGSGFDPLADLRDILKLT